MTTPTFPWPVLALAVAAEVKLAEAKIDLAASDHWAKDEKAKRERCEDQRVELRARRQNLVNALTAAKAREAGLMATIRGMRDIAAAVQHGGRVGGQQAGISQYNMTVGTKRDLILLADAALKEQP